MHLQIKKHNLPRLSFKAIVSLSLIFLSFYIFAQSKDVVLVFRHCEYDLVSHANKYFSVLTKDSSYILYDKKEEGTYLLHIKNYGLHSLHFTNIFGQQNQKFFLIDSTVKNNGGMHR